MRRITDTFNNPPSFLPRFFCDLVCSGDVFLVPILPGSLAVSSLSLWKLSFLVNKLTLFHQHAPSHVWQLAAPVLLLPSINLFLCVPFFFSTQYYSVCLTCTSLPFLSPENCCPSVRKGACWRNSTLQCKHLAYLWVCSCHYRYGPSIAALWLLRRLHIVQTILSIGCRLLLSAAKHERISLMPSSFPQMPTALLYVGCLPSCPPFLAAHCY